MLLDDFCALLPQAVAQVGKGCFLTAGGDEPNPMTIGWAQFGVVWGKPMVLVLVRKSRYTYELLEKTDVFSVSIPKPDTMKAELGYCGSHSGRDGDKYLGAGLERAQAKFGGADGVANCAARMECQIVQRMDTLMDKLDPAIRERFYQSTPQLPDGDPHVLFFGQVLGVIAE